MNSILRFKLIIYKKKNHSFLDCIISKIHTSISAKIIPRYLIPSGVRVKINILVGQGREKNQRVERTEEEKKESRWKCLHGSNNGLVKSIVSPAHGLILFVCIMYTVCTMTKQQGRGLFRFDDVIFFTLFSFSFFTHPLLLPFPLRHGTNECVCILTRERKSRARARERERGMWIKVHANRCNECANKRARVPATAYNEVRKSTPWSLLEKRDSKTRKNTVGIGVSIGV